jgi:competence protein ComEA
VVIVVKRFPLTFIVAVILTIFNLFYLTGCSSENLMEISLADTAITNYTVSIYIGGGVNNPGYYTLRENDTVESLIKAAGGIDNNRDNYHIELIIDDSDEKYQKIDINRAGAWLLEALPGIGEARAEAIIQYRIENGKYRNINELLKVEGVGQETFDTIKDLITVND